MDVYGTQPERALQIIDSAEIVGNLTEDRASLLRAKVFCLTCGEERLDTARQICEALLQSNFVKDAPGNREPVLDLLVAISRKKHDNEQWLRWATEKANFCRQQGNETEALRTEAEIGIILTHLGRQDEGMAKLDDVIRQLDGTRKFNETDACIIALKRKINVLQEQECYAEIIAPAKLIVEKTNDYEQHPDDYHDGTDREPDAADVPGYCDFYRSQAFGFLANAYANMGDRANARQNITLFEQSQYGQTIDSRKMIAPTWCKLGDYDKMLAVYDEMEQRMGTDTICFDYATILHDRAIAAEARGHHAQAYDYMSRYAALSQSLNDSLQASEAHEYAARYHAQEQQLQIEREQAKSARKNIYIWSFVIISLLAIAIAGILFHRYHEIKRKDLILFVEEVEESMHNIDRQMRILQMNGVLDRCRGIILGEFTDCGTEFKDASGATMSVEAMLHEMLKTYNIPVLCGFPGGHGDVNLPLVMGANVTIDVRNNGATLQFNIDGDQQQVNTADITAPATPAAVRMRLAGKIE